MKKVVFQRVFSAVLIGAMGASLLAGCGSKNEGTSNDEGKKVIKFWCHTNEPWIKSYETVIEKFEEKYPEYDVQLTDYPYAQYSEKIQTSLTSNDGAVDVIAVWGGAAPEFIETDALAAVPEDLEKDIREDFLDPTIGIYEKEGTMYGVSMELNLAMGGLLVNKTLFDEANLEYPTTWEEMRSISKQVAKKNGDVMEMRGFDIMDTDALIGNYLSMILEQGGQFLNEDNSLNFATPEGVKAMEEILDMVKSGETDLENLINGEYAFKDLYEGKSFMSGQGAWVIGEGTGTYGLEKGKDFDYIEMPVYAGDELKIAAETGWGLVVPKGSKVQDDAWKFIEFFISPEVLVEHNIACSQIPPRKSLLNSEEYKEGMPDVAFLMDNLSDVQWMGPYNTSAWREIFNDKFIEMCNTENPDVEKELAEISEQITNECQISYSTK